MTASTPILVILAIAQFLSLRTKAIACLCQPLHHRFRLRRVRCKAQIPDFLCDSQK
ncbi:MAG: hypothetical protein ACK6CP_14065 [Pseudanabaena sp.]|nr:hypothetical protein [Pseudanabaena sp. 42896M_M3]